MSLEKGSYREEIAHWAVVRSVEAEMPVLNDGRIGWTTDTNALLMGSQTGNVVIAGSGTGFGDVTGPAGGVLDNDLAVYQSDSGKIIKASGINLSEVITNISARVPGTIPIEQGSTGQHLVKKSGLAFDMEWADVPDPTVRTTDVLDAVSPFSAVSWPNSLITAGLISSPTAILTDIQLPGPNVINTSTPGGDPYGGEGIQWDQSGVGAFLELSQGDFFVDSATPTTFNFLRLNGASLYLDSTQGFIAADKGMWLSPAIDHTNPANTEIPLRFGYNTFGAGTTPMLRFVTGTSGGGGNFEFNRPLVADVDVYTEKVVEKVSGTGVEVAGVLMLAGSLESTVITEHEGDLIIYTSQIPDLLPLLDDKQDNLVAGTNIDAGALSALDTVSVIDSPVFAGTVDADEYTSTETAFGAAKNLSHLTFDCSPTSAWTPDGLNTYVSEINLDFQPGSFSLGHARSFVSDITVSGSATVSQHAMQCFKGTIDCGGLGLSAITEDTPFYLRVFNTASGSNFTNGMFRAELNAESTAGQQIAAYTVATAPGSASAIGYKGYASGKGGTSSTGLAIGVQGYGADVAAANHSGLIGIEGAVVSAGGSTANDAKMGVRSNKHTLIRDGSLFVCDFSPSTPAGVTTDHVDPLNLSGQAYIQGDTEIDGELFCDGNESGSIANATTTYSAGTATTIFAAGTFDVTLPLAASCEGRKYKIKNTSTGVVGVDGTSGDTIDKALRIDLIQHEVMEVQSDGTEWWIM